MHSRKKPETASGGLRHEKNLGNRVNQKGKKQQGKEQKTVFGPCFSLPYDEEW